LKELLVAITLSSVVGTLRIFFLTAFLPLPFFLANPVFEGVRFLAPFFADFFAILFLLLLWNNT
jgi:hypothetical protein